jgi:hypothetical protein
LGINCTTLKTLHNIEISKDKYLDYTTFIVTYIINHHHHITYRYALKAVTVNVWHFRVLKKPKNKQNSTLEVNRFHTVMAQSITLVIRVQQQYLNIRNTKFLLHHKTIQ